MIGRTALEMARLRENHERGRERQHARRDRIRYIDGLLSEFEALNLADTTCVSGELAGKVLDLACGHEHPIRRRPLGRVCITEWMDTLYDLQDPLMITVEDGID